MLDVLGVPSGNFESRSQEAGMARVVLSEKGDVLERESGDCLFRLELCQEF